MKKGDYILVCLLVDTCMHVSCVHGCSGNEGSSVRTCALRFFFWLISILNMYLVLFISPKESTSEVQDWLTYIPQELQVRERERERERERLLRMQLLAFFQIM